MQVAKKMLSLHSNIWCRRLSKSLARVRRILLDALMPLVEWRQKTGGESDEAVIQSDRQIYCKMLLFPAL